MVKRSDLDKQIITRSYCTIIVEIHYYSCGSLTIAYFARPSINSTYSDAVNHQPNSTFENVCTQSARRSFFFNSLYMNLGAQLIELILPAVVPYTYIHEQKFKLAKKFQN